MIFVSSGDKDGQKTVSTRIIHEQRLDARPDTQEVSTMPLYIMMTTLTDEGRKTVRANPRRITEVNRETERMGVKLLGQYVTLGQYDFINIIEAPDNETIAKIATELGSRGTLQTNTLAALTLEDYIESIEQ